MYELIILSLLMYGPSHGYLIAKITNDIIGPWAKVSPGTLYPVLARLERDDCIAAVAGDEAETAARGRRPSRVYRITPMGRLNFHRLMMDISSNPGEYQRLFHLKVPHLALLAPRERLHLLNHYITYGETAVLHHQTEARDLLTTVAAGYETSLDLVAGAVELMEHQADQWQAEVDWTRRLRERVVARIEAGEAAEEPRPASAGGEGAPIDE